MAEENKHIQHVKSNVVNNGKPKLPTPDALMPGEIAVNYAKGYETLSIKNSENEIATFSSDNALAFTKLTNPSDSSKVGLVNSLSDYYDTNIGRGAVIEGDGSKEEEVISNITASGAYSHAEGNSTTASGAYSHAEGNFTTASGDYSHAEGFETTASGSCSHAEGEETEASGNKSHAEGDETTASGDYSHAEGFETTASGSCSHAEGHETEASGESSHAEGFDTTASGESSHAEGDSTTASGTYSHAEGGNTTANGDYSHAEGYGTITNNETEHASGQWNVSSKASTTFGDSGNTLFSVGNGVSTSNRHNAFEIRQNGDIYIVKDNTNVKLQEVIPPVVELTDYLTSGSILPTDDNTIYTYNGQVVEKKIGHNGGGDDIIAFATHRDVDAYDVNNIAVIKYDKGDDDESYHYTGTYNLHNDSGSDVEELKSMFGVHTATTTTDGLMSSDDKIKLGPINIVNHDFVINVDTNAIVLSVGNTELRLDETNLQKLKTLLQNS